MRYFKTSQPLVVTYATKDEIEEMWFALNEIRMNLESGEQTENGIWIHSFITKTNVIRLLEKFKDLDEILNDDWTKGLSNEYHSADEMIKKFKSED